jgi:preprotein translocase subunit SecD
MNQYPLWKYLLLIVVLVAGLLYALPNLYSDDYAVQMGGARNAQLFEEDFQRIKEALAASDFSPHGVRLEQGSVMVRFKTPDEQLRARDFLIRSFPDFAVSLNMVSSVPEWLEWFNARPMALGLDLSGGIHLLFEVDVETTIAQRIDQSANEARNFIRRERLGRPQIEKSATEVVLAFADEQESERAYSKLRNEFRDLELVRSEENGRYVITMAFSELAAKEIQDNAIRQNISTLRTRVDALGVSEPIVQRQGRNRVVVELPGIQDSNRVMGILGAVATLEFRMVDMEADPYRAAQTGVVPPRSSLYQTKDDQPVLLLNQVMMTGEYITDARFNFDQEAGSPIVSIRLNSQGGQLFYNATKDNIGKPMGILFIDSHLVNREVDGEIKRVRERSEKVISVATIRDALSYNFQISGLDNAQEARDLALLLRAGSLAAPLNLVEERTIGPSMGKENIQKGQIAVVAGLILVLIFMALYYRVFGLFADAALLANVVLIVALLSLFQATLTLPGIAGIVLTVGMAVDANVLIYERIREELRNGFSPHAAINAGYDRAFSTIMDANITTLIAAVVLFVFGTGSIKGFAVTLIIGIMTSMFTAIMGTRALTNLVFGKRKIEKLPI